MKKLGIGLLVLIACLYGCYAAVVTTGTWRYRLTITVNDNGTLHTGSSVIEVSVLQGLNFLPQSHPSIKIRGEAVVIDLKEKGLLFALLSKKEDQGYARTIVCVIFKFDPVNSCAGSMTPEGIHYYSNLKGKREVPFNMLPMLVRFRDMGDPRTVEEVDPNSLDVSFGTGVRLEKATIEMTKAQVTTGIEKRLPWLNKYYDQLFDGERYESIEAANHLSNSLGAGNFSTELSPYGR